MCGEELSKGAPLTRRPAAELVVERLLELIHTGSLRAGDTLPTEQEIGAALQVSRPVVREALRGLQILGVVETRQGGRCPVTDLKPERLAASVQMLVALDERNIDSIYEARMVVEGELLARSHQAFVLPQKWDLHRTVPYGTANAT